VDPITAVFLFGAATKFFGGILSGRAAKRAGRMEFERNEFNSKIAELQADDAIQRGVDASSRQRMATRQVVGTQRAGYAAQNIDVNYGSAVDVQADATFLGELDAQQITANAEREAWGYDVQSADYRAAGLYALENGNSAGNAAYFQAAGNLATDVTLLADKYGWPKQGKTPPPTSTRGGQRPVYTGDVPRYPPHV
jgi:hypothetical protein